MMPLMLAEILFISTDGILRSDAFLGVYSMVTWQITLRVRFFLSLQSLLRIMQN